MIGGAQQMQPHPLDGEGTHLTHAAASKPVDRLSWRRCNTSNSVESMRRVSGSPTDSGTTVRRKGSILSVSAFSAADATRRGASSCIFSPRAGSGRQRNAGRRAGRSARSPRPQLLEERQGKHLRVRELLCGLVALPPLVEKGVGVVDEAEKTVIASSMEARLEVCCGGPSDSPTQVPRMAPIVPLIHATHLEVRRHPAAEPLPKISPIHREFIRNSSPIHSHMVCFEP
jgi:hypothetical protein